MNNSEIRNVTKEVLKGKYKNVMLPFILAILLISLSQSQDLYSYLYEAYGVNICLYNWFNSPIYSRPNKYWFGNLFTFNCK